MLQHNSETHTRTETVVSTTSPVSQHRQRNSLTIPIKIRNARKKIYGLYAVYTLMMTLMIGSQIWLVATYPKRFLPIPASVYRTMIISDLGDFALIVSGAIFVTKMINKQKGKPLITITEEGVDIHSIYDGAGVLRWEEIADMRVYRFFGQRMVGIVPKDIDTYIARLHKKPWVQRSMRYDKWCIRRICKPLHIFVAPINLNERAMPMPADALLARIAVFENGRE